MLLKSLFFNLCNILDNQKVATTLCCTPAFKELHCGKESIFKQLGWKDILQTRMSANFLLLHCNHENDTDLGSLISNFRSQNSKLGSLGLYSVPNINNDFKICQIYCFSNILDQILNLNNVLEYQNCSNIAFSQFGGVKITIFTSFENPIFYQNSNFIKYLISNCFWLQDQFQSCPNFNFHFSALSRFKIQTKHQQHLTYGGFK